MKPETRTTFPLTAEQLSKVTERKAALKRSQARTIQALVSAGLEATEGKPEVLERYVQGPHND